MKFEGKVTEIEAEKEIKLVAIDIDGTLFNHNSEITPKTQEKIHFCETMDSHRKFHPHILR